MGKVKIGSKMRVLVLASYCGDDSVICDDNLPCDACLMTCNVAEIPAGTELDVIGGLDYLRELEGK